MDSLEVEVNEVKDDLKTVKLVLETETNRNIKIVAEGHLDLSRKLSDAIRVENEREMFLLRLNTLESEVEVLKKKVG